MKAWQTIWQTGPFSREIRNEAVKSGAAEKLRFHASFPENRSQSRQWLTQLMENFWRLA